MRSVLLPASPALPVSVWLVDSRVAGDLALRLAPGLLDPGQRGRLAAMRREVDRRTYAAGHVALRQLLGARLGMAPEAVRFRRRPCVGCGGPHGRPEAVGGGGVRFSLSHSGDLALIAIAAEAVGVDVERVPEAEIAASAAEVLHPSEAAEVADLAPDLRPAAVARAWTRKEAYLKGTGAGLSRSTAIDYLGTGPSPAAYPEGWALRDVAVPDGYAAAVAVAATTSVLEDRSRTAWGAPRLASAR
ncbi:4'-phosphopantetheinyl transferase superfamily protein [Streptomyces sp. NPDC048270]|uniref:4'-phosphopantetheinyl transferase family protein n=1 Tax=Streptomyces sp. NPDC048270 TaxID=3154615 RepID=UPI0034094123